MVLRWVAAGLLEAAKGFRRVIGCKATVQPDGRTWTITNGRTGYSRNYQSK